MDFQAVDSFLSEDMKRIEALADTLEVDEECDKTLSLFPR